MMQEDTSLKCNIKDALIIHNQQDVYYHANQRQHDQVKTITRILQQFQNNDPTNRSSLFRNLDTVGEYELNENNLMDYLERYQIIFITSAAGYLNSIWKRKMLIDLWYLVKRRKLMVVFLRSSLSKLAVELQVTKENPKNNLWKLYDYMAGKKIILLYQNIERLKSRNLELFADSFEKRENEEPNVVSLSESYICGIDKSHLVNPNDWNVLGKQVDGEKICWMVHKSMNIMFIPFYGHSEGNENQTNLTLYALKYLMYEHLEVSVLQRNLYSNRNILSDVYIC